MDLSIIIVNWNTRDLLVKCINSIYENLNRLVDVCAEIIVIDNASTDGSSEAVRSHFQEVTVISNESNLGFACSNNIAANIALGEFLLFINPDTYAHNNSINVLNEYMRNNPQVGAVGPRVLNQDGTLQTSIWPKPSFFRECW